DPNSFDASDVTVQYEDPNGNKSNVAVGAVTPLDLGTGWGPRGVGSFASLNPMATTFLVHLQTPQSGVGTYSYAVGPDINDLIRANSLVASTQTLNQYASSVIAFST